MALAPPSRVLIISKLDAGTTPEKLRLKFSPFGPIESCKIENGVGIIEYRRVPDAAEAKRRMQHMSISFGAATTARPSIGEVRATSATLLAPNSTTTTSATLHAPMPARSAPIALLCVPEPTHNFLLSPPPSPPPSWQHPEEHDISRIPYFDLEPETEMGKTVLLKPSNGLPKITIQED